VLIMRRTNPEAERPFRCPFVPVVPTLGIRVLPAADAVAAAANWYRLFGWLALGCASTSSTAGTIACLARSCAAKSRHTHQSGRMLDGGPKQP